MMEFAWPLAAPVLLLLPLAAWAYRRSLRAQSRRRDALAAQGLIPVSAAKVRRRRHVPFLFWFLALGLLLVGVLRPKAEVNTLTREGTLILAFDISESMRADDIEPTRIEAARTAAVELVSKQPSNVRIGIVAFSEGAMVTLRPTADRNEVSEAIKRLKPAGSTSLGQGMFQALTAIAGKPIEIDVEALEDESQEVDIGYFGSSAIILLSDGENTVDPDPVEVAKVASLAGVKIYTVGIGSEEGTVIESQGFQVATALDTETLEAIAERTDGTYFNAPDAESLRSIYNSIELKWETRREFAEITGYFAAAAAAALMLGSLLSILWFGKVV
jgi:Ca-activated chloride channel homolog